MRRFLLLFSLALLVAALVAVAPAAAWTWPSGGPVLLAFSFDPAHPYSAGEHRGIDIGGDPGSAVVAPAGGVVTFAGTVPGNGKSLTILTSDGWSITLTQLGSIAVARGATVAEGDSVATIGPSGDAEVAGPYVQLGIRHADQDQGYVDPQSLLPLRSPTASVSTSTGGAVQPPSVVSVPTSTTPVDGASATGDPAAGGTPSDTVVPQAVVIAAVPDTAPVPDAPQSPSAPPAVATPRTAYDVVPTGARTIHVLPVAATTSSPETVRAVLPASIQGAYLGVLPATPAAPSRPTATSPETTPAPAEVSAPTTAVAAADAQAAPAEARRAARSPIEERPLIGVDGALAAISVSSPPRRITAHVRASRPRGVASAAPVRHVSLPAADRRHGPAAFFRWLAAVVPALVLVSLLALRRRQVAPRVAPQAARMMAPDEIRGSEDLSGARLAVCGGASPPWPRGGLRRPIRRIRPLSPAARERRPHGERDGRARYAGDGGRRQGREVGR